MDNIRVIKLRLPLDHAQISLLQAGDAVTLTGTMLVGRDQVHQRLWQLLSKQLPLPVPIKGETIFYMSPSPAPSGMPVGSCGPTTSARMDPFTPALMDAGLLCSVGKGPRSQQVVDAIAKHGGLYLYTFGGCGALYAKSVKSLTCTAFEDLGPEALFKIEVESFPAIVAIDAHGCGIYEPSV